ncbi:hypothetical protein BC834DRAFT_1008994 [Gloeopeniophorella convolvens]|nr:hypothetical protein BC834DRAFT_1008994 [Gloeopeniophorella convolvens]
MNTVLRPFVILPMSPSLLPSLGLVAPFHPRLCLHLHLYLHGLLNGRPPAHPPTVAAAPSTRFSSSKINDLARLWATLALHSARSTQSLDDSYAKAVHQPRHYLCVPGYTATQCLKAEVETEETEGTTCEHRRKGNKCAKQTLAHAEATEEIRRMQPRITLNFQAYLNCSTLDLVFGPMLGHAELALSKTRCMHVPRSRSE